jgi:uncharacterized protein DUF4070
MSRDELRDGYVDLMQELYDPDFYFERLENLFLTRQFDWARTRNAYWRKHPWRKLKSQSVDAVLAAGLFLRLMKNIPDPELPDLSPSDEHHGPPAARPKPLVHLRDQVRDALPPLHNGPPDGRTARAGQHVLVPAWRAQQSHQTL